MSEVLYLRVSYKPIVQEWSGFQPRAECLWRVIVEPLKGIKLTVLVTKHFHRILLNHIHILLPNGIKDKWFFLLRLIPCPSIIIYVGMETRRTRCQLNLNITNRCMNCNMQLLKLLLPHVPQTHNLRVVCEQQQQQQQPAALMWLAMQGVK